MSIPIRPIYLMADSQLLFWNTNGQSFLAPLRESIDKEHPKAAYVGASNGDQPEYFSIFEGAMSSIGVTDCRMIFSDYQKEDRDYLMEADIILLAGGDVVRGWRVLDQTGMGQDIVQRYYDNATLIGISAGAVHLGMMGCDNEIPEEDDLFETFKLIPYAIDAHDEGQGWQRLKAMVSLGDPGVKGMGLPSGGGLIYYPDHVMEPVRHAIVEFSVKDDQIQQTLLFPPDDPIGQTASDAGD